MARGKEAVAHNRMGAGEVAEKMRFYERRGGRAGGGGLDGKEMERGACVSAGGGGVVHYLPWTLSFAPLLLSLSSLSWGKRMDISVPVSLHFCVASPAG